MPSEDVRTNLWERYPGLGAGSNGRIMRHSGIAQHEAARLSSPQLSASAVLWTSIEGGPPGPWPVDSHSGRGEDQVCFSLAPPRL